MLIHYDCDEFTVSWRPDHGFLTVNKYDLRLYPPCEVDNKSQIPLEGWLPDWE